MIIHMQGHLAHMKLNWSSQESSRNLDISQFRMICTTNNSDTIYNLFHKHTDNLQDRSNDYWYGTIIWFTSPKSYFW